MDCSVRKVVWGESARKNMFAAAYDPAKHLKTGKTISRGRIDIYEYNDTEAEITYNREFYLLPTLSLGWEGGNEGSGAFIEVDENETVSCLSWVDNDENLLVGFISGLLVKYSVSGSRRDNGGGHQQALAREVINYFFIDED